MNRLDLLWELALERLLLLWISFVVTSVCILPLLRSRETLRMKTNSMAITFQPEVCSHWSFMPSIGTLTIGRSLIASFLNGFWTNTLSGDNARILPSFPLALARVDVLA